MSRVKAGVLFVKQVRELRIVGKRDDEGNLLAECDCGYSYLGFDQYWDMRAWISNHAARHMLKVVGK